MIPPRDRPCLPLAPADRDDGILPAVTLDLDQIADVETDFALEDDGPPAAGPPVPSVAETHDLHGAIGAYLDSIDGTER